VPPDFLAFPDEEAARDGPAFLAAQQKEYRFGRLEVGSEDLEVALVEVEAPPAMAAAESHRDHFVPASFGDSCLEPPAVLGGNDEMRISPVSDHEGFESLYMSDYLLIGLNGAAKKDSAEFAFSAIRQMRNQIGGYGALDEDPHTCGGRLPLERAIVVGLQGKPPLWLLDAETHASRAAPGAEATFGPAKALALF
jgi:hypothetical protein